MLYMLMFVLCVYVVLHGCISLHCVSVCSVFMNLCFSVFVSVCANMCVKVLVCLLHLVIKAVCANPV